MKKQLNQLPFDEQFKGIFDSIASKLAAKISINFSQPVVHES